MPLVTTPSGTTLCFEEIGAPDAPVMVLIQGLSAHMLGWHHEFCDHLAERGVRVVRFDNRDVGRSQRFPTTPYDIADMAGDTVGLLDALGVEQAHVVGQSMGGMIAQHVAAAEPARVLSLGLIYTTATAARITGTAAIRERLAEGPPRHAGEAAERYVRDEAPCASTAWEQDQDWLRELGAAMWERSPDVSGVGRQTDALLRSPDRLDLLARITAPTTIIQGTADRLISPTAATELHDHLPGSTLTIHPGMGHELPRALWPELVDQLVGNAARAAALSA